MRYFLLSINLLVSSWLHADTMNHYMNIADQIPKMEMKADAKAQAWARSARTVLALTNETLAETLIQANDIAKLQGKPFFCLPAGITLNEATLNTIIQQTYRGISSQQSDKDKMTVSQLAWLGVMKTYPCSRHNNIVANALSTHSNANANASASLQHLDSVLSSHH